MSTLPLPPTQREVLQQALADAIYYRDPPLHCADCDTLGRLCSQCAARLSQARAHLALSRELEASAPNPDSPRCGPARLATVARH